jgi:hypothetical protein
MKNRVNKKVSKTQKNQLSSKPKIFRENQSLINERQKIKDRIASVITEEFNTGETI